MSNRSGLAILIAVMLLALVLLAPSQQAQAQTETLTPTPTATPPYQYAVQLSSGAQLLVERRITYGEIGVIVAVLLLLVASLVYWIVRVVRLWIY